MSATSQTSPDPGPLARLEAVKADPLTMSVVVQRITDADRPETLKDICRAWRVPYGKFCEWILDDRERAEKYSAALRFVAEAEAHAALAIADGVEPERDAVAKAKLQIDTRMRLASKWARDRYGESSEVRHTGQVSLVAVLSGMPRGREIDVTPQAPAPLLEADTATLTIPQAAPLADSPNVPVEKPAEPAAKSGSEGLI